MDSLIRADEVVRVLMWHNDAPILERLVQTEAAANNTIRVWREGALTGTHGDGRFTIESDVIEHRTKVLLRHHTMVAFNLPEKTAAAPEQVLDAVLSAARGVCQGKASIGRLSKVLSLYDDSKAAQQKAAE